MKGPYGCKWNECVFIKDAIAYMQQMGTHAKNRNRRKGPMKIHAINGVEGGLNAEFDKCHLVGG
jgi:hypothetical protein